MATIIKELAKKAITHGIRAVNPRELVQKHVAFQDNHILIHAPNGGPTLRYALGADRRVVVLGAGKATAEMCQGLIDAANRSANDKYNLYGAINIPKGQSHPTHFGDPNSNINIKINFAAHPILDQSTIDGTLEQLRIINETASDHPRAVVVLMSGGGSSLFELPQAPLSLHELQTINGLLLKSGADITELNAVRKHLSAVKGGQLARHVIEGLPNMEGTSRNSVLISLVLSDVIGDPLDVIASGPTVPDTSTYADAMRVIQDRIVQRGEAVPAPVLQHVQRGVSGELSETPKPGAALFERVTNHVIGSALTAELAVSQLLRECGVQHVTVVTRSMKGEARAVGQSLSHMIAAQLRGELVGPGQGPALNSLGTQLRDTDQMVALVCTGECTVTVRGKGRGGRNQELLLAALVDGGMGAQSRDSVHEWQQHWDWTVISAAFDGIEGNSPAMGAVIDASSVSRVNALSVNARAALDENDSYRVFQALGDALEVGHTGTNVNDMLLVLLRRK